MSNIIRFKCIKECSSACCGGATIITLSEISGLYRLFPITLGFQKVYPLDAEHEKYLQEITFRYKNFYIIGDFIAGNRFNPKCRLLKNALCAIQDNLKPLQCRVVPFSVTFPEEYQDKVIISKKKGAFRKCKGFAESYPTVWDGAFVDDQLRKDFYALRESLIQQRELMENFFSHLTQSSHFAKFLISQDGILEAPLTEKFLESLFAKISIENPEAFKRAQRLTFIREIGEGELKNPLFKEVLDIMDRITI
ncbi:hypothetical protein [Thermodesulfovibrio sp.]|uniref:hypothetical protein n=1 Tax=Thermodesulfovibrio TaxID=28261 RepID=UPI00262F1054|nr:hypothetical protein [Thermodesulfovibrio sp.]